MTRTTQFITLGATVIAGAIAFRRLSKAPRRSLGSVLGNRMLRHMGQMMASLPENSPPKLVMSVLPRLRDQNDQMIAMLREQNALLREQIKTPH